MPNKHFCQGTHCHTNPTSDRFLKSKGIIRGRYARLNIDYDTSEHRYWSNANMDKYFCSQGCANSWLSENMSAIEMGIPVPFIRERRFTKGYEKRTTTHDNYYGNGTYTSSSIQKIGVDNNAD
jgi:hypothetical protein